MGINLAPPTYAVEIRKYLCMNVAVVMRNVIFKEGVLFHFVCHCILDLPNAEVDGGILGNVGNLLRCAHSRFHMIWTFRVGDTEFQNIFIIKIAENKKNCQNFGFELW